MKAEAKSKEGWAWAAGAFSAFGLALNTGRGKRPTLLVTGNSRELPEELKRLTGFGQVAVAMARWKWSVEEPMEIAAVYRALRPYLTEEKQAAVESVWLRYRVSMQERDQEDPGWINDLIGQGRRRGSILDVPDEEEAVP